MFYYKKNLVRRIRLHPEYIGNKTDLNLTIKKIAMQEIKGQFSLEHGYFVMPICVTNVGDGYCLPLVGFVEYAVTFEAICLFPVVGEVVYAEVVFVSDTCIMFRYACMYGVVRSFSLNDQDYFKYEEKNTSTDLNLVDQKVGTFRSQIDEEKVIQVGTAVRVLITRRTLGGNGFFLVGSMCSVFLGTVKNPPSPVPALESIKIEPVEDPVLKNLKIEEGIMPHEELQKVWKIEPYNKPAPLSPTFAPLSLSP